MFDDPKVELEKRSNLVIITILFDYMINVKNYSAQES